MMIFFYCTKEKQFGIKIRIFFRSRDEKIKLLIFPYDKNFKLATGGELKFLKK